MIASIAQDIDLTGLSILVVEDEFYLAMEMRDEIRRAGGNVIGPAADLADGMRALAGGGIDCAVVDINLGGGSSYDLADALQTAAIPFVFLTGYDTTAIPDRFDAVERRQKPADDRVWLQAIERLRNVRSTR